MESSESNSANSSQDELPALTPTPTATAMIFPYTGIFSPGGFLSELGESPEEDVKVPSPSCSPKVSTSNLQKLKLKKNFDDQKQMIILSNTNQLNFIDEEVSIIHQTNLNVQHQLDESSELNSEDTGSENDLAATKVFAIDHILEQILASSKTSDLFTFRLVCHRWNTFATPLLQSRITLNFYDYCLYSEKKESKNQAENERLLSLKVLTTLLQNSIIFPCTKFYFVQNCTMWKYQPFPGNLSDTSLANFLSTYGVFLHELALNFADTFEDYLPRECIVISQVMNLLLYQAPNLRYLSLRLPSKFEWKANKNISVDEVPRGAYATLRTTDPEFDEICVYRKSAENLNTKLKVVKLWGDVSSKMLETVIQLCPNLKEIILDERFYYYLLEPFNRLHFLRKMEINVDPSKLDIDVYETIVSACEEGTEFGCTLRELSIRLRDSLQSITPSQLMKVVNVLNRIIICSYRSLEALNFNGVSLLNGINWPREMPRLKKLELGNPESHNVSPGTSFFSPGFSFLETFPKLQSLRFYDSKGNVRFADFLKCLGLDSKPVRTVKCIHIINWHGKTISPDDLKMIQELFPVAQFARHWI